MVAVRLSVKYPEAHSTLFSTCCFPRFDCWSMSLADRRPWTRWALMHPRWRLTGGFRLPRRHRLRLANPMPGVTTAGPLEVVAEAASVVAPNPIAPADRRRHRTIGRPPHSWRLVSRGWTTRRSSHRSSHCSGPIPVPAACSPRWGVGGVGHGRLLHVSLFARAGLFSCDAFAADFWLARLPFVC